MSAMLILPRIEDPRGNLSFIEHSPSGVCPFEIEGVRWLYDVPAGALRSHSVVAGRREMIIAISGSFDVEVLRLDGSSDRFRLLRSDRAILVDEGREVILDNFSTNSVALILSGK